MGALLSFSAAPLALFAPRLLRRQAVSDIAAVARSQGGILAAANMFAGGT
jgi:hypothetical protein